MKTLSIALLLATGLALIGILAVPQVSAQTSSSSEKEILKLESRWSEAVVKRDTTTLQRLYADEYLATDPGGDVWNKVQDIASIASGTFVVTSFTLDDMKAHIYGKVAVVTGSNDMKGTYSGKDISGKYRFTDVFVKRSGRWQCVATQATLVPKK